MKTILRLFIAIGVLCTSLVAADYNRVPAGQIKGARLSYVSTNSIKVGVGYGEVSGSYWEIGSTDPLAVTGYTMTSLVTSASGLFHYIYVDRANSSFPTVAIRDSVTAPTWNANFMGWYDGADRCIGVLWSHPNGTLRNFTCPDDVTYNTDNAAFSSGSIGTATNVWNVMDINPHTPVNTTYVRFIIEAWSTSWSFCAVGLKTNGGPFANTQDGGSRMAATQEWLPFERGADRKIQWMAYASSSSGLGGLTRYICGYRIER